MEAADGIFCCSVDDQDMFGRLYGVPAENMILLPNGVFVDTLVPPAQPRVAGKRLKAIFIASNYPPNVDAADFIIGTLAPAHGDVDFVLAGGIGVNAAVTAAARGKPNVVVTGPLFDAQRLDILHAADFAINPMQSGSGTNIKMFDFMAVALPVVATPVGARGIPLRSEGLFTPELVDFSEAVATLKRLGADERNRLGEFNRRLVCQEFAWETLSVRAGAAIEHMYAKGNIPRPPKPTPEPVRRSACADMAPRKIGLVSTYDIKCGIAGYGEDFAAALKKNDCQVHVFAAHPLVAERVRQARFDATTAWFYDDFWFANSKVDLPFVVETAKRLALDHVSIQYHVGFFRFEDLVALVASLEAANISCSVTLHDSFALSAEQCAALGKHQALLFVHDGSEVERILPAARVCFLPFGIPERPPFAAPRRFAVGTFGFLRPHKGIYELIAAFDMVRAAEPEARLMAFCSEYPNDELRLEGARCKALVAERRLQEHVTLERSFLSRQTILAGLAGCDVNVLPYLHSNEGASAAANYCLASGRPLITSRARIFEPLGDTAYRLESTEPAAIALAILGVLHNPALRADLEQRVARSVDERNWNRVAAHFLEAIEGR